MGTPIGTALNKTGLAAALINAVPFASWNILSNFISNSAAANLIVPILAVVGTALLDDPNASESFIALGGLKSLIVGVIVGVVGIVLAYLMLAAYFIDFRITGFLRL